MGLKEISNEKTMSLDASLAKTLVGYSRGKLTKAVIENSLSIIIVNAAGFKYDINLNANSNSLAIVTAASFYGKVKTAAQSMRKLKNSSSSLYNIYMKIISRCYIFGER